jgi:DUF2993 family protein
MRGCLSILVLAALFVVGAIWFAGPPIASTVLEATLTSSGFAADELDVSVDTSPPLVLVVGRADRVTIRASGVHWNGLEAETMALEMADVDLFARTAGHVDGSFDGVELAGPDGEPVLVSIDLNGPAEAAATTVRVDRQTVERIAKAAFEGEFGVNAESVRLVAPNEIRLTIAGLTIAGRLEVFGDGGLAISSPLGPAVTLVAPDPSLPLTLTGLSVDDAGLVLTGTLEVSSLIR